MMQRAFINIRRKSGKSLVLLVLIFLLANLIIGAFSIRQAVSQTEARLMGQLPAVASIGIDQFAPPVELGDLTLETIHRIGSLPHVAFYDVSIEERVYSRELLRSHGLSFVPDEMDSSFFEMLEHLEYWEAGGTREDGVEIFSLRGVSSPDFVHVVSGLVTVSDGSEFTAKQVENGAPVALISRQLAQANNLQVGSVLNLENNFYFWRTFDENLVTSRPLELTVVGIFDINLDFFTYDGLEPGVDAQEEIRLINRIYVPFVVAEEAGRFVFDSLAEVDSWIAGNHFSPGLITHFYLHDSRQLSDFANVAETYLVGWEMQYLSSNFGNLVASMENMLWIFDWVFYVSISATVVISALIITLFLRDRREEIGIYLALGAPKRNVIGQILWEVMSIALLAFTLSIF